MLHSSHPRHGACLGGLLLGGLLAFPLLSGAARAQALFAAGDVDPSRFLLVAAPIGTSGDRFQLNIYEQIRATRPCFAVGEGRPAAVNPLLGTFDFTGICGRFIDANGYSLRIGGSDLATTYRLSVVKNSGDILLVARPTGSSGGGDLVVARAGGVASGFLKLDLEPGWSLKRRQFGGRSLGHLYVYNPAWPTGGPAAAPAPAP